VVGDRDPDGDTGCHGFLVRGVETTREPLGEHHRGHILFRFQSHWIAQIPFRL
jgi:hypothetical protein